MDFYLWLWFFVTLATAFVNSGANVILNLTLPKTEKAIPKEVQIEVK